MAYDIVPVSTLPATVRNAFRTLGIRKKNAIVTGTEPAGAESREALSSYWDGGSRPQYAALRRGELVNPPCNYAPPQFMGSRETVYYTPEPGDILVKYGTSCGKPATPVVTFYE